MAQTTVRTVAEIRRTLRDAPKDLWADDCEVLYNLAFLACGGKTTTAPTGSTAAPTDNTEAVAAR